jgi:hypothetical protein
MKRLILPLALVALTVATAIAVVLPGEFRKTVTLTWDYDPNAVTSDSVFKLYSSTNVALPFTNWTPVGTVSGTIRTITVSNIAAQQCWFAVTFSNWWGESLPSNIAGTPQIPGAVSNLRISQ